MSIGGLPGAIVDAVRDLLTPDTVAIFDSFTERSDGKTPHGVDVEFVVDEHGQVDEFGIRRFPTGGGGSLFGDGPIEERIENRVAALLDSTSDNLEAILASPGAIEVINQSQSQSEIRVVDDFLRHVNDSRVSPEERAERRSQLASDLGLPDDVSTEELTQRLVDVTSEVFTDSERIAESRERYVGLSEQLDDAGILHVITAGNLGGRLDRLDKLGIEYDADFTDSVLATEDKIVVAASTGGDEEEITDFSTPSTDVDVAIDGEAVEVSDGRTANGTSFAAPQVTALIDDLRRINPELTNGEIREILVEASSDTGATDTEEGAGILDPARARELAEATLVEERIGGTGPR